MPLILAILVCQVIFKIIMGGGREYLFCGITEIYQSIGQYLSYKIGEPLKAMGFLFNFVNVACHHDA